MNERFSHGGNIYQGQAPAGGWLDFSANINPLGLSPTVREVLQENLDDIVHYPDPAGRALKAAIAAHYQVPEDGIVLGNGATELFYLFFHVMRPKNVCLPVPSFGEYERSALAVGASVDYFPLDEAAGFTLPTERLRPHLEVADCVVLGNPNNPAGSMIPAEDVERLAATAQKAVTFLLVDESFMDFRDDVERYTVRAFLDRYENLLLIQSLTKFYALPGLRLGFAVASPALARRLEAGKDPWNVNHLAQKAGVAALSDVTYQNASRACVRRERLSLAEELRGIDGLYVYEPTVNYILLRLPERWGTATVFAEKMRAEGILVRDCSNYPGLDSRFLRVAVRDLASNQRLLAAFRKITEAVP